MARTRLSYLLVVVLLFGARVSSSFAGPDVIVGDLYSLTDYARLGDTAALAVGTTSCNAGNQELGWYALPDNRHPVIGQNLYRLKDGRLQQIGQAWLKHGFTALQGTVCFGDCQPSGTGSRLGVHCSDPYGPSLNSGPDLGPRSEVNPVTGNYNGGTANDHTGHTHTAISHGLQVKHSDLGNAGALYYIEGHYIAPDDAANGNGNNNASYKQYTVTGSSANWTFTAVGATVREQPAIMTWSGATFTTLDSWPVEGRVIIATKVTPLGGTQYRYDYGVYNMNSERGIRSFSIPVGTATITNIGFSAPLSHDEGLSNTAWASLNSSGDLTWSTDPYATDPNANAIRWGTMYNFWFDANVAPVGSTASLGRFKPGAGAAVIIGSVPAPAPGDCNNNSVPDDQDVAPGGGSADCNSNIVPDECELDGNDCNTDNIPDDCQMNGDCNSNGLPDVCDAIGDDCDTNGVPDGCQPDCDFDGTIDPCEGEPDCNANGTPDTCDINGQIGGTNSYPSGTINLPILDNQTTTSNLTATEGGNILDVNVQLNITHTYDADLIISLSHGGTTVALCSGRGGSGNNFTGTTFDDEAATPISAGSAPFSGSYRPEQPLTAFDGQQASGVWMLTVSDTFNADQGTLINWTLTVQTPSIPPTSQDANNNGIPDECECATCSGDVNSDDVIDGGDVQAFADALMGAFSPCADMNTSGPPLTQQDIDDFAAALLDGTGPCP